jgi:hypothetical protein
MTAGYGDIDSLREVIGQYFDGLYHADPDRLARVFHPMAHYASATGGELLYRTVDDYLSVVAQRVPPAAASAPREDAILCIEFAGPLTARAVLSCVLGDRHYTDWLTFLKLDGRWQVMSKIFHHEPREAG